MLQRAKIRTYLQTLFEGAIDVESKVFFSRPDPVFLEEIPCIVFGFESETATIRDGDAYEPRVYIRTLSLVVDVMTAGDNDHLDYLCNQVEATIAQDHRLGKALDDYDPEAPDGLCGGISFTAAEPYEVSREGEHKIRACRIKFSIPYLYSVESYKKLNKFSEFQFEILDKTIDGPVLSAGEVSLT